MNKAKEKHPSLQRRIRYGQEEIYYRYLGINLPLSTGSNFCSGRFGNFLDKKLGIRKLPYGITIIDLASSDCITPTLKVELPFSYFEEWINFPHCPRQSSGERDEEYAEMYSYESVLSEIENIEYIIHPYDGGLKTNFVERYRGDLSLEECSCQHPNGRQYKAGELYFSYWQGLALASSIHKINNIELHLPPAEGVRKAKEIICSIIKRFCKKYGDTFERVSWYRVATAAVQLSNMRPTFQEIISELSKHRSVDKEILTSDLENLLYLYAEWRVVLDKAGSPEIKKALEILRKDIYLVFEQLSISGVSKDYIFEAFSNECCPHPWARLQDVLYFENHSLKEFFNRVLNRYCERVQQWGFGCTPDVFDDLTRYKGFYSWIRPLHDLHQNIKWEGEVDFTHSRIVDYLVIASVRTEVVIREMLRENFKGLNADDDLLKVLLDLSDLTTEKYGIIFKQLRSESGKTKLHSQPDSVFAKIESISYKKWFPEERHFLKSILKFICIRNYFAHHSYKDEELDVATSELASEIIKSIIEAMLYFYWVCNESCALRSSGDSL